MGITFSTENSMCNLLLFPKLASSKRMSEAEEAIKYTCKHFEDVLLIAAEAEVVMGRSQTTEENV